MSYVNTYSLTNKSAINFLNDAQLLWYYVSTGNGNQPSILNKDYNNFYEFILTSGEKKVLILENIITSDLINLITNNDKTLLKKVYISNNCEVIHSDCFNGCTNLTYVSYTNVENNASVSLTTIKSNAFLNCSLMQECRLFNITNSITTIENDAFSGCSNLFEIKFENTQLTSIGENAFLNCNNIVTLTIPSTINTIGNNAFSGCSLTNIYFNGQLPSTIGTTIFGIGGTPLNAICYYYNNLINNTSYTSLKNLFPNNNQIVFVERNNNNIENRETFYTITNNGVDVAIVNKATEILDSLLIRRIGSTNYNINIAYDSTLSGTSTLGYANWSSQEIRLNPDNNTNNNVNLNNQSLSMNILVLVHEILHIFGFGSGALWTNFRSYDIALDYHFTGKNAIYQYNKILELNGYEKKLDYLTIEDSGGLGTMGSHTEEGYFFNTITYNDGSTQTYSNAQIRGDSKGNVYPSLQNDIMSGYLGNNNFFTRQCCGVLQDLEFSVNYNSPWFYDNNISFYPSITYDNINITSNFDFNNVKDDNQDINNENIINFKQSNVIQNYKFKCNCCNDNSKNSIITPL
jgi:hypothetical protein